MLGPVDVLIIIAEVLGAIIVIDIVLLYFIWRVKVISKNVDRRMQPKKKPESIWKEMERNALQAYKDDKIFEEVDRSYGAPW